jgi:hypothetical protein
MKYYFYLIIILSIIVTSCCKVQTNFIGIKYVKFSNFQLSDVDTFFALPHYADSILPWNAYQQYQETTSSLEVILKTNKLTHFQPIEIVLKDTSKRFVIVSTKSLNVAETKKRCSPVNVFILEFSVNGAKQTGDTIFIAQ